MVKRPNRPTREQRSARGKTITIAGKSYSLPQKVSKAKLIKYPDNIANEYVVYIEKTTLYIQKALDKFIKSFSIYSDALPTKDEEKRILAAHKQLKLELAIEPQPKQTTLFEFAERISDDNKRQFDAATKSAIGFVPVTPEDFLKPEITRWIKENSDLIKSIGGDAKDRVQKLIDEYVSQGLAPSVLQERLQSLGNLTKNKAALIARDQTGKFFGKLNEQRSLEIGIRRYIWRTAGDLAVRHQHMLNNGKVFTFGKGDPEGNDPGFQINCRCIAEPLYSDLFK